MTEAAFAAALLAPETPALAGLRTWNGSDPAGRLAVHRNNLVVGLVDVPASGFPVLQVQVGGVFFRAMAAPFVRQHPPSSPVPAWCSGALPGFIADFSPAAAVPCLADVARLE